MSRYLNKDYFSLLKNFVLFVLTFISLSGCISSFDMHSNRIILNGDSYLYIPILIGYFCVIKKMIISKERRLSVIASILSFVISVVYILCYMTSKYFLYGRFEISLMFLFFIFTKLIGIFILFFILIKFIFKKVGDVNSNNKLEYKYFTCTYKSLFFVTLIIFIAYIPYLVHSFPGNLNYDFIVQIKQSLSYDALTNWHPYVHTLFIGLCLKIGHFLTNSYNIGIFIYTLIQVLLSCFTFAFVIFYMAKKRVNTKFRLITLLFFMFFPIFPLYSVWLTKDIIFSLFMVFITIGIIEICTNKEVMKSNKYIIFMIIIFLFAMLSRKNGFYMLALLFPIILLINRKYWIRICIIFLVPILIFKIIDGPIREHYNIPDGSKAEMYSIPAQQMARIYKYEFENLTFEQKQKIEKYIKLDNIEEKYNPLISDPIKGAIDINKIDENKIDLLKFNLELFLNFPRTSIESFLCTTYRFYYLDNDGAKGLENFKTDSASLIENMFPKELNIRNNFFRIKIIDYINNAIYLDEVLLLSTTTTPGIYINIIIICIGYLLYMKKYKHIVCFFPVLLILITQLAGPMVDIRYAYCIFTCFPVLLAISIYGERKQE